MVSGRLRPGREVELGEEDVPLVGEVVGLDPAVESALADAGPGVGVEEPVRVSSQPGERPAHRHGWRPKDGRTRAGWAAARAATAGQSCSEVPLTTQDGIPSACKSATTRSRTGSRRGSWRWLCASWRGMGLMGGSALRRDAAGTAYGETPQRRRRSAAAAWRVAGAASGMSMALAGAW